MIERREFLKAAIGCVGGAMMLGVPGVALAQGNVEGEAASLSGAHFNLNIIGVKNAKNANFKCENGNAASIFVLRGGRTRFFVHGVEDGSYQVLDRDGTDGYVGTGIADPGILLPFNSSYLEDHDPATPDVFAASPWRVNIYVRMLGKPNTSTWSSYTPGVNDKTTAISFNDGGSNWYIWDSFTLTKDGGTKFSLVTDSLLSDEYQDMLWQLDASLDYRICQMRIYLLPYTA
ncbi:MAG: twin-arginine translocation signal domain-containing protein [Actinobacteria bacterium]|nr:twin-arginine translocation signal domain-containing protein [Actinomycetota bacterium]